MPAPAAQLAADLEQLLRQALRRCEQGTWDRAADAIQRASQILLALLNQLSPQDPVLQCCQSLLHRLSSQFTEARTQAREQLDQIHIARIRLRPTRRAYTQTAARGNSQHFAQSA